MKTLVIYDSFFGNTEKVARAVGEALGLQVEETVLKVGDVKPGQIAGLDLLVVGSPTRGFRPSEAIQNFLKDLPQGALEGVRVAAFDTRIAVEDVNNVILTVFVKIFGYAARRIADRLKAKGGTLIAPPEGFYVKGTEGPLKEGELERVVAWAKGLK